MKLLAKELEQRFKEVGNQSEFENPILLAKFHVQEVDVAWYPITYDPSLNCCYGYVTGFDKNEFDSFSMGRLDHMNKQRGGVIKQDPNFQEVRLGELFPQQKRLLEQKRNNFKNNQKDQER